MFLSIKDTWNNIEDLINNIQDTINDIKDLFITLVNFFPSPFKEILLATIGIIIIVIIYRIVKG